jgi:hypothetical protein
MASERDRQLLRARELDQASTVLINTGVNVVKRNPIKVGMYFLGLLLCLFFTGYKVGESQRTNYNVEIQKIDYDKIDSIAYNMHESYRLYQRSKGWFSCDENCKTQWKNYESNRILFEQLKVEQSNQLAVAKSQLGLFSEFGVEETRNLFWEKFAQGKGFAQRQTKWDALFIGIRTIGRDESIISYIFSLILSMLFNFTIGVCGTVITFMFSLGSLIRSYNASILQGLFFFISASLAAVAFALTWLIGLYSVTAGTAYVGLRLVAANLRIENSTDRHSQSHRIN